MRQKPENEECIDVVADSSEEPLTIERQQYRRPRIDDLKSIKKSIKCLQLWKYIDGE